SRALLRRLCLWSLSARRSCTGRGKPTNQRLDVLSQQRVRIELKVGVRSESLFPDGEQDDRRHDKRCDLLGIEGAQLLALDTALKDSLHQRQTWAWPHVRPELRELREISRLGHNQLDERWERPVELALEDGNKRPQKVCRRTVERVHQLLGLLQARPDRLPRYRLEEVFLIFEVEVDRRLAYPRLGRDVLEPRASKASMGEELKRGGNQLPGPGVAAPLPFLGWLSFGPLI